MLLAACGGVGGSVSPTPSGGTSNTNSAPTAEGGSSPGSPTIVDVRAGTAASGVDIQVVPPRSSPPPNAQDLGVNPTVGQGSASNTGALIHRGSTMRVLLFGPGINGQMTVRIAGPNDISASGVTGIQATDNTPGIAFIATVRSSAALGARTVYLQDRNGDITSFTGGLEVVP